MDLLAREIVEWPHPCKSNESPRGQLPSLNVSVKLSALYSQIHPADPATAIDGISERLRPILRRAAELAAFINFDMESYALKDLTLRLFKTIFAEAEFARVPECGLALQAYLKDCEADLREVIAWARAHSRRVTIRLVKGAYLDYETIIAHQRHWPVPVFAHKAETDANFEKLSLALLENDDAVDAAFGTHNVRSIAYALAQAERFGVDRRNFEFQMLYGMADPIKSALLQLGCRLREYCPVGELLPGMAYLVRRLLENTSNEGFLANKFAKGASRVELLKSPASVASLLQSSVKDGPSTGFQNEPHTDFTSDAARMRMRGAIQEERRKLGQRHPLIINGKSVSTADWLESLNPANQREIIGYAAQGSVENAE